ncbi:MAG: superoxide dismutase [Ni] [Candidatus Latescibacterota bacterium]|nr:superoxide dismutase [Ni] [Candidatus Latescibacterota bacterium]
MRGMMMTLTIAALLSAVSERSFAHCEIPCGIYGDELRFSMIQEDIITIEKSMKKIVELAGDPAQANQVARWVLNKEHHSDHIREIVAQYFMTQRIKLPDESVADVKAYRDKLVLLHKMLVYAMKSKQTTDTANTKMLHETAHAFEALYSNSFSE